MSFAPAESVDYDTVESFFHALGLEPNFVKEVIVTPRLVEVTTFAKNDEGKKYVDLERGVPAVNKHQIHLRHRA